MVVRETRRGSSSVLHVAARAIYRRVEWLRRHRGTQPPALQRPGPAPGIGAFIPPNGDLLIIYPKPYSIYLRGATGIRILSARFDVQGSGRLGPSVYENSGILWLPALAEEGTER